MMDAGSFTHFATRFLAALGAAALRAILLACVAGILLALFRMKNVAVRLAVWKLTLWSALAMPLLALVLPPVQFAVPGPVTAQLERIGLGRNADLVANSRLRAAVGGAAHNNHSAGPMTSESADVSAGRARDAKQRGTDSAVRFAGFSSADASNVKSAEKSERLVWKDSGARMALAVYLAIAGLLLSRLFVGWIFGRRLIRGSAAIRDPRASLSLSLRAFPGHLRETPVLAASEAVAVPVTLGVARPVILLPSDWREWIPIN